MLENRVALVTGAGSGIGRATAMLLAKEGARVGLLDLQACGVAEVAAEIARRGGRAIVFDGDVSQVDSVKSAVDRLAAEWGRLDIVFANAGINGIWAPVEEIEPQEWDEVMGVNLRGTFLTVKHSIPHLKERGGSIIIGSSVNGTHMFSNSGVSAYASSKAGQTAFAKMIALELARYKIRVNVICPGWIESEIERSTCRRNFDKVRKKVTYHEGIVPLTGGRPGKPEQVARLVLFLASDASDHITGSEILIDGGESLLE